MNFRKTFRTVLCAAITAMASAESEVPTAMKSEPTPESMLSKGISPITGTFIQEWLFERFTDERWDQELKHWKELGIEYVIVGDGAMIDLNDKFRIDTSYPSKIPGAKVGKDVLGKLFEKCAEHRIKVFIGMGNTYGLWPFLDFRKPGNAEIFQQVCTRFADIAEDLHGVYGERYKDVFAGFYYVPELHNHVAFDDPESRAGYVAGVAGGFDIIFERLNRIAPELPFIMSPYVNLFGGDWVSKDIGNIGRFWSELFKSARFREGDIFMPQDSVGAGGMDLEHLDAMTKAYADAVKSSGKGIRFWANCENFIQPPAGYLSRKDSDDFWSPCTTDRMVRQFQIVSKYSERLFTFAHPHYLSPFNTVPGFCESYRHYLRTGKLDATPPKAPDTLRTSLTGPDKRHLRIDFSGAEDNFGISRVNLYKNGELLTFRVTSRSDGLLHRARQPDHIVDESHDPASGGPVSYELEVIDCAGNTSGKVPVVCAQEVLK